MYRYTSVSSSDEETIEATTFEGLCSPPEVISGKLRIGKEAEWLNDHPCINLERDYPRRIYDTIIIV